MRRTQIYLDDEQEAELARRSHVTRRTKSALIREAIDRYLAEDTPEEQRLSEFKLAADAAFGSASQLPPGADYVEQMRSADATRFEGLERRWRAGKP